MPKPAKTTNKLPLRLAIDGNEANVPQRVGSNVYALETIKELYQLTKDEKKFHCTVLLSQPPLKDFPEPRKNWQYQVITPKKLWTQWALPLHLFWYQKSYDAYFTASHYAPRVTAVPYVNTIHDLAFLEFPQQFQKNDLYQLKHWTAYSIKRATKIIAVSDFTKQQIHQIYQTPLEKITVASPAVSLSSKYSPLRFKAFLRKHNVIQDQYFLYLGTLQPRKNLPSLIEAFEAFCRWQAADKLGKNNSQKELPQLVIAGKKGWLAKETEQRIDQSPVKKRIILTGFFPEELKKPLYEHALATFALGSHEGFGIPPLEALSVGTPAIVANSGSLPNTVGNAGKIVDLDNSAALTEALKEIFTLAPSKRKRWAKRAINQAASFSWQMTAKTILETLTKAARNG